MIQFKYKELAIYSILTKNKCKYKDNYDCLKFLYLNEKIEASYLKRDKSLKGNDTLSIF